MAKKCNCEQKQAAKLEGEKIVLRLNNDFSDVFHCFFCGEPCYPDGFDFFVEGTGKFVCTGCVKEKAPDLFMIHEHAHQWREKDLQKSFEEGVTSGKTTAGQMILDAITEPELERVKRVCRVDLGAKPCLEEIPF